MPLPLIPIAVGAFFGAIWSAKEGPTVGASMEVTYPTDDSEATRAAIENLANAQARNNADWMERTKTYAGKEIPCCVGCAGIGYIPPTKCEGNAFCQPIRSALAILNTGQGTCIDLACYDAAAKIWKGKDAEVKIVHEQDSTGAAIPFQYHAVVVSGGKVEDPTAEILAKAPGCNSCAKR